MIKIYLDYAAATPVHPDVLDVMLPFFSEKFYNPSAIYQSSQDVKYTLENARKSVAHTIGSKPSEIYFTAGGTESANLAINGVMQKYPNSKIIVSAIEHDAVLKPAQKFDCHLLRVNKNGLVDPFGLNELIDDNTVLVSVMYANNEIGAIQPIRALGNIIKEIRTRRTKKGIELPLYFHTDACQAALYLDLHVARLGVDMMTLNGGKMYGPKQSGALYINSHTKIIPQVLGGGQERNLRSGTENVAFDVGFAKALELAQTGRRQNIEKTGKLQKQFIEKISEQIPSAIINGSLNHRLPNNVHVSFPGYDNERLIYELDERGIMVASGSACGASNEESSHVLKAIGMSDEVARSSVRFTLGLETSSEDINIVLHNLTKLISR